jgi:putative oligomerization/nucleic acid binding protein
MHFEVSERLITNETPDAVMEFAQRQFSKISNKTRLEDGQLTARMVEASFGSINRSDVTHVALQRVGGGYLLVSETDYRPSGWFWIFLIVLLFSYIGWLIPIAFYFYQRGAVKSAIQSSIDRIVNEFSISPAAVGLHAVPSSKADELKKLAELRDGGVLSDDEFTAQKLKLLRS